MKKRDTLTKQGIALIIFLVLQYLLGMATNLFVQFPEKGNDVAMWKFTWSRIPLALHIILGIGLLIGSVALLLRSLRQKNKIWIKASLAGMISILISGVAGSEFVSSQADIYSFIMAAGFIAAILSYGWGAYKSN